MENSYSFKEFEKVKLKALDEFAIGDRVIVEGEIIASFDRIMIAGLNEIVKVITAHGGFADRDLVIWENSKGADLIFTQGVFSPTQFALANNIFRQDIGLNEAIKLTTEETCEADEHGVVTVSEVIAVTPFVYVAATGEKVTNWTWTGNKIQGLTAYKDYVIQYQYNYLNGGTVFMLGERLYNGYFELEGQTTFKDDKTGAMLTGILKLPKLKMNAGMSIRLGTQANPNVVSFSAKAYPVGERYFSKYGEFYILNDDLSSDIL